MARLSRQVRRTSRWREFLSGPQPAVRTVEVLPPSHQDEASWVFLTAAFVCLCVIYIVAFQTKGTGSADDKSGASATLSYMVLFRDLPSPEQRLFREMQEGMQEALRLRGTSGDWPTAESLAKLDVPPFGSDVLDKSGFNWTQRRDGLLIEYVGVPSSGAGMPAFLIQVQEPEPTGGEQPAARVVDEEHQLLPDGKLLHVTYWKRAPESLRSDLVTNPVLEGWTQIRITDPFQITEVR